ncbi:hypothetical protein [Tenacibaculum agarivorans]|uniref:hypothetical protein n=1 Tax=Tenacibaculum agarivorans TaxID=1908389 RepID=UPI00094BAF6A|nr:hypothetical protein [Tenacibaculum agarivorans]
MDEIQSEIEQLVNLVPISSISSWLKTHDKPHSHSSKSNFIKNLVKWVKKGDISLKDIEDAVIDVEENGGKKIKLKLIKNFDLSKLKKHLNSKGVSFSKTDKLSLPSNVPSKLNYIYLDEEKQILKIKWSETQESAEIDYQKKSIEAKKKIIFVIVVIDVETGFTQIRYDTPQDMHSYINEKEKKKDSLYEEHYLKELKKMLPVTFKLEDYYIGDLMDYILKKERKKFRIENENVKISQGSKQRYSRVGGDIRDLEARQGAEINDGSNWVVDNLTGYWINEESQGKLVRDLFMRMSKVDSAINFHRDCLSQELNYAIDEIRQIKGKI